ncbi:MAG: multidrug efflux SMR transporter [Firmicutes bacterium]|nr:multidrug efflux SMR transporter [Bacillota bacterium]
MAYLFLALGIVSEVFGTAMLKASDGFTNILPAIGGVLGFSLALYFLALSYKSIPLSVAYATWCGVGIVGASLISFIIWRERLNVTGIIGIILILIGIVLVNITSPSEEITNVAEIEQTYPN